MDTLNDIQIAHRDDKQPPVYVVHFVHWQGHDISVFSTEQKATAEVAAWARGRWHENEVDGEIPGDDDTLIERYFEAVDEYYDVIQTAVDDLASPQS